MITNLIASLLLVILAGMWIDWSTPDKWNDEGRAGAAMVAGFLCLIISMIRFPHGAVEWW